MDFDPHAPLTVARIREVVERYPEVDRRIRAAARNGIRPGCFPRAPDLEAGETAEDVLAEQIAEIHGQDAADIQRDHARIQDLLDLLARGTVEEAMARPASGVRARQLRRASPWSVEAVLQALDVLEPLFGHRVNAVRRRHGRAGMGAEEAAAGARRTGDPRRPPLTEERIRRVLGVLAEYAARSPRIRAMLLEPMKLDETGADARKRLGVRLSAAADRDADGAEGLVRDVFWMMLIYNRVHDGRGVDSWLREFEASSDPGALPGGAGSGPSRKAGHVAVRTADASAAMVRLLRLVSRDEEAAVFACRKEIQALVSDLLGWPSASADDAG